MGVKGSSGFEGSKRGGGGLLWGFRPSKAFRAK